MYRSVPVSAGVFQNDQFILKWWVEIAEVLGAAPWEWCTSRGFADRKCPKDNTAQ